MRSLFLSTCFFWLSTVLASAQTATPIEQTVADEKATILQDITARASAAYLAQQNTPTWVEPATTASPSDLVTQFCDARLDQNTATHCPALGAATQVDDPLRIARAVGYASGTWLGPRDDDPSSEALADQVAADATALTTAVAQASRRSSVELVLSGPALQITGPSNAPTFDSLFPNGIGTDDRALDRAMLRIVTLRNISRPEMESLLTEMRASLTPEQQSKLPDAAQPQTEPEVDLSGLVGNPMACEDTPITADLRPFELSTITLPSALRGIDPLAGFMVSAHHDQPIVLDRVSTTQARVLLPMHPDGASGGDVAIVLMFEDGELQIDRRCAAQFITLQPPRSTPGAYPAWLDDMGGLMTQTNTLATTLEVPAVFPASFVQDRQANTAELKAAYAAAGAQGKFALDALATGMIRQGVDPDTARHDLQQVTADIAANAERDEGRFEPFNFRPGLPRLGLQTHMTHRAFLHEGNLDTAFATFDPSLLTNYCPASMEELDKFIRLQKFGAFADTMTAKVLYTTSGVLMSLSATLVTQSVSSNAKAAELAGKSVSNAYTSYGIYQGFLKGMLPSSLPLIKADVSNTTIFEDQPDLRVTVDRAILVAKSLGWDVEKAAIDALTAIAGMKLKATGPVGRKFNTLLPSAARDGAIKRVLSTRVVGDEALKTASTAARSTLDSAVGGVASFMDAEIANYIYGLNKQNGGQGISTPPTFCEVDMLDEDWTMITLEDRDLVYQNQSFGIYRPVRDGRATLNITPRPEGDRFGGLKLPVFSQALDVPRLSPERVSSPGSVVPGASFEVEATITNSANPNTQLSWDVAPNGVVSTSTSVDLTVLSVQTTRNTNDFPLTVYAGVVGDFLPQSDVIDRTISLAVQAGGLWLVPTRSCISPGGEAQIFVFDAITGAEVPAHDLAFDTDTAGIDVDGNGLVTSQKEDTNVTIYARGVGANGYRGQVTIRADCTCGIAYFDPKLVVPANTSGPLGITAQIGGGNGFVSNGNQSVWVPNLPGLPDVFAIDGTINVEITGDVNLNYSKPFALDLLAVQADGPYGPACSYLTGGISGVYLGTQMLMASQGGLLPADTGSDLRPNAYNAGAVSFSLEDFGGPDDFGTLYPSSGVSVSVMALEPGRVAVELVGQFEGFKYIPFLQGLREDINVSISTRFESN